MICLSVTSETRHDTRDQRESLRGRAPRSYSGQISPNLKIFGEVWKILEKICTHWCFLFALSTILIGYIDENHEIFFLLEKTRGRVWEEGHPGRILDKFLKILKIFRKFRKILEKFGFFFKSLEDFWKNMYTLMLFICSINYNNWYHR